METMQHYLPRVFSERSVSQRAAGRSYSSHALLFDIRWRMLQLRTYRSVALATLDGMNPGHDDLGSCIVRSDMLARVLTVSSIISFCLLTLLLVTTAPGSAGPVVILLVFILMYLSLLGAVTFLLFVGTRVVYFLTHLLTNRKVRTRLSLNRAYLYATVLAALPMIVMGLYSVNGIRWYELVLVGIFGAIGVLYIVRRTKS